MKKRYLYPFLVLLSFSVIFSTYNLDVFAQNQKNNVYGDVDIIELSNSNSRATQEIN